MVYMVCKYMVYMVCMSCYGRLLRVLSAGAAEGEASRRERRDGWTLTVRSGCFASCLKSQGGTQNGSQDSFVPPPPAAAAREARVFANSALSPPPLAFHLPTL